VPHRWQPAIGHGGHMPSDTNATREHDVSATLARPGVDESRENAMQIARDNNRRATKVRRARFA